MGGYISVLYKNYDIPVYNENQYAVVVTKMVISSYSLLYKVA